MSKGHLNDASVPNERSGVDAGWALLFAFTHTRPRATQAEC